MLGQEAGIQHFILIFTKKESTYSDIVIGREVCFSVDLVKFIWGKEVIYNLIPKLHGIRSFHFMVVESHARELAQSLYMYIIVAGLTFDRKTCNWGRAEHVL